MTASQSTGCAPSANGAPRSGRGRQAAHLPYEIRLVEAAPLFDELAVGDTNDGDKGDGDRSAGGGNAEELASVRPADRQSVRHAVALSEDVLEGRLLAEVSLAILGEICHRSNLHQRAVR